MAVILTDAMIMPARQAAGMMLAMDLADPAKAWYTPLSGTPIFSLRLNRLWQK